LVEVAGLGFLVDRKRREDVTDALIAVDSNPYGPKKNRCSHERRCEGS
jgi:hypothetical protein